MNKWERGVAKFLTDSEFRFITDYDQWLRTAFAHIPIGGNEHVIHGYNLTAVQRLSSILSRHTLDAFTLGEAHADADCKHILSGQKRKLAGLPTVNLRQAPQGDNFIPLDAIKVLQSRAIVLAGQVENDVTAAIKEILLKHLVGLTRPLAEQEIAALLEQNMNRASLIVTTETTYAYNRGRLISYVDNKVDYVMFRAIMDARTCAICSSRNGLIAPIGDIGGNTPPVHGRCRCVLSPVYSQLQPQLLTPAALDWSKVAPLPKGWVA